MPKYVDRRHPKPPRIRYILRARGPQDPAGCKVIDGYRNMCQRMVKHRGKHAYLRYRNQVVTFGKDIYNLEYPPNVQFVEDGPPDA